MLNFKFQIQKEENFTSTHTTVLTACQQWRQQKQQQRLRQTPKNPLNASVDSFDQNQNPFVITERNV